MPVTELLRRNAAEHGNEVALVEINPTMEETRKFSYKEYDLVQQTKPTKYYRRQLTWQVFEWLMRYLTARILQRYRY